MAIPKIAIFNPSTTLIDQVLGIDGSVNPTLGVPSAGTPVCLNPNGLIDPSLGGTGVTISNPPSAGAILQATGVKTAIWVTPSNSTLFGDITTDTNTAATMTVGTGAALTFSGSGVVNANTLFGVTLGGTVPTTGWVLTATSPTTADWEAPSGGGGSPGGASGDIQYNNSGFFGGSAATTTAAGSITVPTGQSLFSPVIQGPGGSLLSLDREVPTGFRLQDDSSSTVVTGSPIGGFTVVAAATSITSSGYGITADSTGVAILAGPGVASAGTAGQVLTSNGTHSVWQTFSAVVALPNASVQFNNSGAFGGSANFEWNGTTLVIKGATSTSGPDPLALYTFGGASPGGTVQQYGDAQGVLISLADAAGDNAILAPLGLTLSGGKVVVHAPTAPAVAVSVTGDTASSNIQNWFTNTPTLAVAIDSAGNLSLPLAGVKDHTGSLGTSGQILSSTGTGTLWVPAGSGSPGAPNLSIQGNNGGTFAGVLGSVIDFTNGLISLAPTGTGVALSVTGDAVTSDIQEWFTNGAAFPNWGVAIQTVPTYWYPTGDPVGLMLSLEDSLGNLVNITPSNTEFNSQIGGTGSFNVYMGGGGFIFEDTFGGAAALQVANVYIWAAPTASTGKPALEVVGDPFADPVLWLQANNGG